MLPQVYFALSSDIEFSGYSGARRQFSHREFYLSIIQTVLLWSQDDHEALLLWWTRYVAI